MRGGNDIIEQFANDVNSYWLTTVTIETNDANGCKWKTNKPVILK